MKITNHYIIKEILFDNEKERDEVIEKMEIEKWEWNKLHPLWFVFRKDVGND